MRLAFLASGSPPRPICLLACWPAASLHHRPLGSPNPASRVFPAAPPPLPRCLAPAGPCSGIVFKVVFRGEVVAAKQFDLGSSKSAQEAFVRVRPGMRSSGWGMGLGMC